MQRIIFHLDLDAFFVAVERLLDPSLCGQPVIVSPGTARSVVSAASYEARKFGVHSAQPIAQARRLCPQAILCPDNFKAYQKYSRAFFKILAAYSPDLEPASLDEGYMDYTACTRLFGPPLPQAGRIQEQVREELGLDVSIGISSSKLVSKIASDLAKPAGILHVLPGHEADLLSALPIRRLIGVGPKTEPRLRQLGIRTIGELARLPRGLVGQAFGDWGFGLQDLARGQDDSAVAPRGRAKSVSNEETFAVDTTDVGFLKFALQRLVCEVGYRLRQSGLRAATACVKVRYADFSLHTRSETLPEPTDLDRVLYESGERQLGRVLTRRVLIRLLGFGAQNLETGKGQSNLFDVSGHDRLGKLHAAADKIKKRYGYDSVSWASLKRQDVE
jgi:DNA polymerase-4